jgi:hypothetical protein
VSPYIIVDAATSRNVTPGAHTDVDVIVCLDRVIPVFTSLESLSEFARVLHPAGDPIWPTPLEVDPIRLATMASELEGVKRLAFDPAIRPSGVWIVQDKPWPVRTYCRYIAELDRTVNRLRAEVKEKHREKCSDPEYLDKIVNIWIALHFDEVEGDVRARVEEWEIDDGF